MDPNLPTEPDEGDYTTSDHVHWFQYGKCVLVTDGDGDEYKSRLAAHMKENNFYPDAWWISDHGNAHLITWEDWYV